MVDARDLLIGLSQCETIEVDAVTAKGENRWVGIMIGCLKSEVNGHSIDDLGGYDAHITLGYFPREEPAPSHVDMATYMKKLHKVVEHCFKPGTTTTIRCTDDPDSEGLRVDEGQLRSSFYIGMKIKCKMYDKLCRIENAWRPPNFRWKNCFHVRTFSFVSVYQHPSITNRNLVHTSKRLTATAVIRIHHAQLICVLPFPQYNNDAWSQISFNMPSLA